MREIIDTFVSRLPLRVSELLELHRDQKVDDLRRAVHQIKGAGGGYG